MANQDLGVGSAALSFAADSTPSQTLGPSLHATAALALLPVVVGQAKGNIGNPVFIQVPTSLTIDLSQAQVVDTDPTIVTGSLYAGSVWVSFSVTDSAQAVVSIDDSDVPGGAQIEIWVGPDYTVAGANVRLIGWTGYRAQALPTAAAALSLIARIRSASKPAATLALAPHATLAGVG